MFVGDYRLHWRSGLRLQELAVPGPPNRDGRIARIHQGSTFPVDQSQLSLQDSFHNHFNA